MRDSAFTADKDRFAKEAFSKNVGKVVPLKFEGEEIGTVKLLSVIVNEGFAQAVFDVEFAEDAGPAFRNNKPRAEVAFVEDRKCRCTDHGKSPR